MYSFIVGERMCFVKLCFKKKLMGICAWRDVWRINKKDKSNIWLHMPDENVILRITEYVCLF